MEKVAIYGWAFNPPTLWHQTVMTKMLSQKKVDKIIFTPDWDRLDKDYWVSKNLRIKMLENFYESILNQWFNVDFEDHFLKQKAQKTTTMDVERYFIEKLGLQPHHIFWIDVIESMPNWSWNINHYLENDLKKIFLNRKWFILPKNIAMKNYIVLDLDILEVSSTMARQAIKTKQSVDSILSLPVRDFVLNNKMYA